MTGRGRLLRGTSVWAVREREGRRGKLKLRVLREGLRARSPTLRLLKRREAMGKPEYAVGAASKQR